jgi:hypothetical protein
MDQVLAFIIDAIIKVIAFIVIAYIVYLIYFSGKSNISDEDLDRISKGGDH